MNRVRAFFNSSGFIGAVAVAGMALLTYVFAMPNADVHKFTRGEDPVAVVAAVVAPVVFITWLYFLPKGTIRAFFKGPGFVGLVAVCFTMFLTYLFITA
ncbi:MAG: hypothetical protein ACJ74Q_15655 [Pyrinomonadaceae bacterium]